MNIDLIMFWIYIDYVVLTMTNIWLRYVTGISIYIWLMSIYMTMTYICDTSYDIMSKSIILCLCMYIYVIIWCLCYVMIIYVWFMIKYDISHDLFWNSEMSFRNSLNSGCWLEFWPEFARIRLTPTRIRPEFGYWLNINLSNTKFYAI